MEKYRRRYRRYDTRRRASHGRSAPEKRLPAGLPAPVSREILARLRREPVFPMAVACRLSGLNPWQIRWAARRGLLRPGHSPGGDWMFSLGHVERLACIRGFLRKGVNAAGIREILFRGKIRRR